MDVASNCTQRSSLEIDVHIPYDVQLWRYALVCRGAIEEGFREVSLVAFRSK